MHKTFVFFILSLLLSVAGFTQTSVVYQPEGALRVINQTDSTPNETFDLYFYLPMTYREQVVLSLEVFSDQLVDFRYIQTGDENLIGVAKLKQSGDGYVDLRWQAKILAEEVRPQLPTALSFSDYNTLPLQVKKWLDPTDCVQSDHSEIREMAEQLKELSSDPVDFITRMMWATSGYYLGNSPDPYLHDAYSAFSLKQAVDKGMSNLRIALFRAMGIPARQKAHFRMQTWTNKSWYSLLWGLQVYFPDFGWFNIGSNSTMGGQLKWPRSHYAPVMFISYPEDEFSVFTGNGQTGRQHVSHPQMRLDGDGQYISDNLASITGDLDNFKSLFKKAYNEEITHQGNLTIETHRFFLNQARGLKSAAIDKLVNKNLSDCEPLINQSLEYFDKIPQTEAEQLIYEESFESGISGWQAGGAGNAWVTIGIPEKKQLNYPGSQALTMQTIAPGNDQINSWILSPPIDLRGLCRAGVTFRIWNEMKKFNNFDNDDYVILEVSLDGTHFTPLSGKMCGYDHRIKEHVGGWNKVSLDMTAFVGNRIQLRFKFLSKIQKSAARVYVDSIRVFGREFYPGEDQPIHLQVIQKETRSLLFKRNYYLLKFEVSEPSKYSHFWIWRKGKEGYFEKIVRIEDAPVFLGKYSYRDQILKDNKAYTYLVTGNSKLNPQIILGISPEITGD